MERALVILCGGKSTRMGTDKALLPFGDSCLIEYLVSEFSPYFSKIYLSVKIKGDYAHLNLDVTEIPDLYANAGPLSGVFSALSMIDEDKAFFMSVDTPFLEPATGIHLLEELEDAEMEPFMAELESKISGKKIALFGSYGWGGGEWMRDWEARIQSAGATVVNGEGIIVNGEPDDDIIEELKALGKALA